MTVGAVAGDEESYETFAPLFDKIISARHGGYSKLSSSSICSRSVDNKVRLPETRLVFLVSVGGPVFSAQPPYSTVLSITSF